MSVQGSNQVQSSPESIFIEEERERESEREGGIMQI